MTEELQAIGRLFYNDFEELGAGMYRVWEAILSSIKFYA